ncbi:MAG: GAF domain-containing sensor histidine kinase [Deltaproteobacteria bacterium]|nr:GAF domain-containing sensor histidine kinase [Deltaproteobacteria bacterium]
MGSVHRAMGERSFLERAAGLISSLMRAPNIKSSGLSRGELEELVLQVRNRVVYDEVGRLVDEVENIIEINPNLGEREILEAAAKHIVEYLGAAAASIRIFDPQRREMVSFGSYDYDGGKRQKTIPFEDSIAGEVVKRGRSYLVPNIMKEDMYQNKGIVREMGIRSMLAVPMNVPRFSIRDLDIKGVIQIYYEEEDRRFMPLERKIAEVLARRVTYVIARKRILSLQRLNETKEKIVEKIYRKLGKREGIRLRDFFILIIPEIANLVRIQSCSLFSVRGNRREVALEAGYPEEHGYHEVGRVFDIRDEPYFDAVINQEPLGEYEHEVVTPSYLLIKNPSKSQLITEGLRHFTHVHNIHSILYIPLKVDELITHFIAFDCLDPHKRFEDEEVEILSFFGKEVMKAVRLEKLHDILHDFRNPAIATAGFAKRVKRALGEGEFETKKEAIDRDLNILIRETSRMQELAFEIYGEGKEELRDITGELVERFEINEVAIGEQQLGKIDLVKEKLQPDLFVMCYPLHLGRIFDNLLSNATNAISKEGGEIAIKSLRRRNSAVVEITNTGEISGEEIIRLLGGETGGRGLRITNRLVQLMGGRLEIESGDNRTTSRVILPLRGPGTLGSSHEG